MEKTKQRIGWIDVTKGIAILLVILGHSLVGPENQDIIFAISHAGKFFITSGNFIQTKKHTGSNSKKMRKNCLFRMA